MAFKIPFPVFTRKCPSLLSNTDVKDLNLPDFTKKDFTDVLLIGQGSFGKVFKGIQNGKTYVIKELSEADPGSMEIKLFVKEAEILKSVQNHENIVNILGFSKDECSILLNYVEFSFKDIGIDQQSVPSLKDFLKTLDRLYDFQGFDHCQQSVTCDISRGFEFLHSKDVVHRDLKPDNILTSNSHLSKYSCIRYSGNVGN